MAKKLRWVPNQINIANLPGDNKSVEEVMALTGAGKSTVQKVQTALNQGQKPPSLKEVAAELTPTPKGNDKKPTGIVRFVASRIDCEYTPIMIIARQAAVKHYKNLLYLTETIIAGLETLIKRKIGPKEMDRLQNKFKL